MPQNRMAIIPDRWMPSDSAYGRYVKTIIMLNSKEGFRRNSTYFNKYTVVKETDIIGIQ